MGLEHKKVIRKQALSTEINTREEAGPTVDESQSSDDETREERSTQQNQNTTREESSPPNRKTPSLNEIFLTAPYADI